MEEGEGKIVRPGGLIAGLTLLRPLGRGGMGEVWLAEEPSLRRQVAVKILSDPPGLPEADRERRRARFLREARTMASLDHPSVLPVYQVGEEVDGRLLYFTMKPCLLSAEEVCRLCRKSLGAPLPPDLSPWREAPSALPLSALLFAGATLSPAAVAGIGLSLVEALAYSHGRRPPVVHRDVKPANVLFDGAGKVYLADFGVAKKMPGDDGDLSTASLTVVSPEGRRPFVGTDEYASPEQKEGGIVSPASDYYSLGLVLYRALVGRLPGTLTPPSRLDPGRIVRGWDSLFEGLLEVDPARRLTSPDRIRARLRKLAAISPRDQRRGRIAAWAIPVLLALASGWLLVRDGRRPPESGPRTAEGPDAETATPSPAQMAPSVPGGVVREAPAAREPPSLPTRERESGDVAREGDGEAASGAVPPLHIERGDVLRRIEVEGAADEERSPARPGSAVTEPPAGRPSIPAASPRAATGKDGPGGLASPPLPGPTFSDLVPVPAEEGPGASPGGRLAPPPPPLPIPVPAPGMIWTSDADGRNFRQVPREKIDEEVEKLLEGFREKYPEPVIDSDEWQEEKNRLNFVPPYPAGN